MKKIKGLLFAFVALFAFTIAMVKVSAEGEIPDNTYSILPSQFYDTTSTTPTSESYVVPNTNNKLTVTLAGSTKTNTLQDFGKTSADVKNAANNTTGKTWTHELKLGGTRSFDVEWTLTTKQSATLNVYAYCNGGGKYLSLNGNKTEYDTAGKKKVIVSTGTYTSSTPKVTIEGNTSVCLLEIEVIITTSNESDESLAAAAIDRIGTVTYSQECLDKLVDAKALVEACADPELISNIETYRTAVSTFDELRQTKRDEFANGVQELMQASITASSEATINELNQKYDALLSGDKALVSDSFQTLLNADDELYHHIYDGLKTTFDANNLAIGEYTKNTRLDNSIFVLRAGTTEAKRNVSVDKSGEQRRLKLNGTFIASGSEIKEGEEIVGYNEDDFRVVKFFARNSGTLKVNVLSANSSNDRKLNLYANNLSGTAIKEFNAPKGGALESVYHIEEGGWYFLGSPDSGVNILSLSFEADPEPSSEAYFDAGYNAAGTELIRGIIVCENVTESQLTQSLEEIKVTISGEGLPQGGFDITSYFQIGDSIYSNGGVYSFTDSEGNTIVCGAKENVIYAIVVVAVSNDGAGLAEEYVGKELTISVSAAQGNEQPFYSWTYTVKGAQQ